LFVTITVSALLSVGFSHARCPSGDRTSSIRMGRAAIAKANFCSSTRASSASFALLMHSPNWSHQNPKQLPDLLVLHDLRLTFAKRKAQCD